MTDLGVELVAFRRIRKIQVYSLSDSEIMKKKTYIIDAVNWIKTKII